MKKVRFQIGGIPALLWGEPSDRLFIAVHGNMSSKEDTVIQLFAEQATAQGFQVLSFDLPEHGDRKNDGSCCKVQNCMEELAAVMDFAKTITDKIGLFACSMGAYFSLLAYREEKLGPCFFLSPVVNMKILIDSMMEAFHISEEELSQKREIAIPDGPVFYWDYYRYVESHPIEVWDKKTTILHGSDDRISDPAVVLDFAQKFQCKIQWVDRGEHFFYTEIQLYEYKKWLNDAFRDKMFLSV